MTKYFNRLIAKNEKGSDYVVGDIHGCFSKLQQVLDEAGFDEATDRLFTVGDLVDRGPESELVDRWLSKPWFYSTCGNHERMAIDFFDGFESAELYSYNGGGWFVTLDKERQRYYVELFKTLPLIIEVQVGEGKIGIVHAECLLDDWEEFKKLPAQYNNSALWGRHRIKTRNTSPVKNIDTIYVGHTPLKEAVVLGTHHFIDTGAVYGHPFHLEKIN